MHDGERRQGGPGEGGKARQGETDRVRECQPCAAFHRRAEGGGGEQQTQAGRQANRQTRQIDKLIDMAWGMCTSSGHGDSSVDDASR